MDAGQGGNLSPKDPWRFDRRLAKVSFGVFLVGALALRTYWVLRFATPATLLDLGWLAILVVVAACGAVAAGIIGGTWRFVHGKKAASVPAGDDQRGNIPPKDLWTLAWCVAVVAFLVLFFGALALRAYWVLRFATPETLLDLNWLLSLFVFAVCGAVTTGTVAVAWRLMHRKKSTPNWSMAFVLLGVLLFGLLVWPTPWTYREYGCQIFQINRFVGSRTPIARLPQCDDKQKDARAETGN